MKVIFMKVTFPDNSYIETGINSNTYVGDIAHRVMHLFWKTCRLQKIEVTDRAWFEFVDRVLKPTKTVEITEIGKVNAGPGKP
jgi:hypothetical protein